MAKVVCKNCGHKNPSSAAVCENCGSFMFEDPKPAGSGIAPSAPQNIEQEPQQATVPENSPSQPVDQAHDLCTSIPSVSGARTVLCSAHWYNNYPSPGNHTYLNYIIKNDLEKQVS